jgi:hypothetical protein
MPQIARLCETAQPVADGLLPFFVVTLPTTTNRTLALLIYPRRRHRAALRSPGRQRWNTVGYNKQRTCFHVGHVSKFVEIGLLYGRRVSPHEIQLLTASQ